MAPKIKVTHYTIRAEDPENRPRSGLTMAVLADLHNGISTPFLHELSRILREEIRPDALLCCGDQVTTRNGVCEKERILPWLKAAASRYPTYMVSGNHERRLQDYPNIYGDAYRELVLGWETDGIRVLDNETALVNMKGMKIALTGLSLPVSCYFRRRRHVPDLEEIRSLIGPPFTGAYRILLAHHPDYADIYAAWGADLVLSGHLHGGIIRLPLLGGVLGGTFRPFPKYDMGAFSIGEGQQMIVSAGLGMHTLPFRFYNPPELCVLHFSP